MQQKIPCEAFFTGDNILSFVFLVVSIRNGEEVTYKDYNSKYDKIEENGAGESAFGSGCFIGGDTVGVNSGKHHEHTADNGK